jgi:hypothetical protein
MGRGETPAQSRRPIVAEANMGTLQLVRTHHTCPRCGWSNTRRSQLDGAADRMMALFLMVPIRCRNCRHRFFRFRSPWLKYLVAVGIVGLLALMVIAIPAAVSSHPQVFGKR